MTREFIVRGVLYVEYRVTAEDADDAAAIVNDGEGGNGECVDTGIASVVSAESADDLDADDERAKCTCGHLLDDGHSGMWSGPPGQYPKPNPLACNTYGCGCRVAVARPS